MPTKRCTKCKETLPADEFYRVNTGGLMGACKSCILGDRKRYYSIPENRDRAIAASRARYANCDKDRRREEDRRRLLLSRYGMTPDDFEVMVAAQDGRCALCLRATTLHVDHCHETGRIRGLLCLSCNTALGRWGDNADGLRRVFSYLDGTLAFT